MADLERWEHGDPEKVAIRRESMTCKGCVRLTVVRLFGNRTEICGFGKQTGKRCKSYTGRQNAL